MERQHRAPIGYMREGVLKSVEKLYHPTVNDPANHLATIRALSIARTYDPETHVEQPRYNFITAFNHISYDDPILALWLYWTHIDPEFQRPMLLPASYYHMRFFRNPIFSSAYFLSSLIFSYERASIIQAYQVGNPKYGFTKEQAQGTYRSFLQKMTKLRKNGSFSFMIAPEGHRSEQENSSLQEAEQGMGYFIRKMSPCVVVPLGITYKRPFDRSSLNPKSEIQLYITEPIILEKPVGKKEEEEVIENVMIQVGAVLPEQMRGFYTPQIEQSMRANSHKL